MSEIWKDVEGYEGYYQVSNKGRLRSLDRVTCGKKYRGKILHDKGERKTGYVIDTLCREGIKKCTRRHRLVAEAFLDREDGKTEVNHLDGNKGNNCVDNLEWVSPRANKVHAWKTGLTKKPPYRQESRSVLQIRDGVVLKEYDSLKEAGESSNVSAADICKCCAGKRKTAGGFVWRYKEDKNE